LISELIREGSGTDHRRTTEDLHQCELKEFVFDVYNCHFYELLRLNEDWLNIARQNTTIELWGIP
jgi:hypothetical protein